MNKYYNDELAIIGDINEVFNVIPDGVIQTPFEHTIYRTAKTDEDFKLVFENKFKRLGLTDRDLFLNEQIIEYNDKVNEIRNFKNQSFSIYIELFHRFLQFLRQEMNPVEMQPDMNNDCVIDCRKLLSILSKHISGINDIEFANVITNNALTSGTPKAKWIGSNKSEARYFADKFKLTDKEFNNCFVFKDVKKLTASIRPTTKKPFKDLLRPFIK